MKSKFAEGTGLVPGFLKGVKEDLSKLHLAENLNAKDLLGIYISATYARIERLKRLLKNAESEKKGLSAGVKKELGEIVSDLEDIVKGFERVRKMQEEPPFKVIPLE